MVGEPLFNILARCCVTFSEKPRLVFDIKFYILTNTFGETSGAEITV